MRHLLAIAVCGWLAVAAVAAESEPPIVQSTVLSSTEAITDAAWVNGRIVVARRNSALVLSDDGTIRSTIRYENQRNYFPVALWPSVPDGVLLLAQDLDAGKLDLVSEEGRTVRSLPLGYAVSVAPLTSDSQALVALEVRRRKKGRLGASSVAFFDLEGRRLAMVDLPYYITAMRADGDAVLASTYPDANRGTTMYRIRPDGQVATLHSLHAIADFTLLRTRLYAAIDHDAVEIRDRDTGQLRRRIAAAGAGRFRDIVTAELPDGSLVIALDGRGGVERHRILWVAPDGSLLFDHEARGHAQAALPLGDCGALVALDHSLLALRKEGCTERRHP